MTSQKVLLRAVDKHNNSVNPYPAEGYIEPLKRILCQYEVNKASLREAQHQAERLSTGYSEPFHTLVRTHLNDPKQEDSWILDAWAKCGRTDHGKTLHFNFTEASARTMTPLGVACLLGYIRAWIDAATEETERLRLEAESIKPGCTDGAAQSAPTEKLANPETRSPRKARKPAPRPCKPHHCPPRKRAPTRT